MSFVAASEVLLVECDGWRLVRTPAYEADASQFAALEKLFISVFVHSVEALNKVMPLPEGSVARVALASVEDARTWGVPKAVGFCAVAYGVSNEDGDDELEISDLSLCMVIPENHHKAVMNDELDLASVQAALVTVPHEMLHVAQYLRSSGGKTPLEVFDRDQAEPGCPLRNMSAKIERDAAALGFASRHGAAEDEAERFGQSAVDSWQPTEDDRHQIDALLKTLLDRRGTATRKRSKP